MAGSQLGALNVGIDGALSVGIDGALNLLRLLRRRGLRLGLLLREQSPARALDQPWPPLATCATSTAAVAANGVVAIVIASAAAHARSAPFARAIAHAPRDERVVVRDRGRRRARAAIMSLVVVCVYPKPMRRVVSEGGDERAFEGGSNATKRACDERARPCVRDLDRGDVDAIDAIDRDGVDPIAIEKRRRTLDRGSRKDSSPQSPGRAAWTRS